MKETALLMGVNLRLTPTVATVPGLNPKQFCCKITRMPVRYVIDKKQKLILTIGEDVVTFAEIKAHQDQLLADTDYDPKFNQLIDASTATEMILSIGEAKQLARRKVLSPESRRAIVASEKSVYGMFRLMQAYHELTEGHSHIGMFCDRDEALKWLGVKEDSGLY